MCVRGAKDMDDVKNTDDLEESYQLETTIFDERFAEE